MDNLFFWLSKLLWLLLSPASILVLWIFAATLLLVLNRTVAAKRCLLGLSITVFMIALMPIGLWLLEPLERRFTTNPQLPQHVDGIVVLSGGEDEIMSQHWQQVELNQAAERNLALVTLAKRFPQAKLVHTGGSGRLLEFGVKQADVAKQMFEQLGVDMSRMQFERNARNTAENASLSYQMIQPQKDQTWVLITTAWHMPRSIGLFCQVGWSMIPYPVDHRTLAGADLSWSLSQLRWSFDYHLADFNMAIKEWLGLTVYYLTGKTPSLLPSTC